MAASRVGRILHGFLLIFLLLYLNPCHANTQQTKVGIMHYGSYESLGISCERDEIIMISSERLGYTTNEQCEPMEMCSVPYTLAKWYCRGKSSCAGIPVERRPLHKRTCGSDFTNCLRVEYHCVRRSQLVSVCGNHNIQTTQLYLTSPSFPDMYPPEQDCACTMTHVQPNTLRDSKQHKAMTPMTRAQLRLKSVFFLLKATRPCKDWVSVTTDHKHWGVRCGYNPKESLFKGRDIEVKFHSDEHNQEMGFWMELSAENNAPFHLKCGQYLNSEYVPRGNLRRINNNRYRNRPPNRHRWMKRNFAKQGPSESNAESNDYRKGHINQNPLNMRRGNHFRVGNYLMQTSNNRKTYTADEEYLQLKEISSDNLQEGNTLKSKRLKYHEIATKPNQTQNANSALLEQRASIFRQENKIFEKTQLEPTLGIQYKDGELNIIETDSNKIEGKELVKDEQDGDTNIQEQPFVSNTIKLPVQDQANTNADSSKIRNPKVKLSLSYMTNNTLTAASAIVHQDLEQKAPKDTKTNQNTQKDIKTNQNTFTSKQRSLPTTPYMMNMNNLKKVTPPILQGKEIKMDPNVQTEISTPTLAPSHTKYESTTTKSPLKTTQDITTGKNNAITTETMQSAVVSTEAVSSSPMTTKSDTVQTTELFEATTEEKVAFLHLLSTAHQEPKQGDGKNAQSQPSEHIRQSYADGNTQRQQSEHIRQSYGHPQNVIEAKEGAYGGESFGFHKSENDLLTENDNNYLNNDININAYAQNIPDEYETTVEELLASPTAEAEQTVNVNAEAFLQNELQSVHIDQDKFNSGFFDQKDVHHILSTPKENVLFHQGTTTENDNIQNSQFNQNPAMGHNVFVSQYRRPENHGQVDASPNRIQDKQFEILNNQGDFNYQEYLATVSEKEKIQQRKFYDGHSNEETLQSAEFVSYDRSSYAEHDPIYSDNLRLEDSMVNKYAQHKPLQDNNVASKESQTPPNNAQQPLTTRKSYFEQKLHRTTPRAIPIQSSFVLKPKSTQNRASNNQGLHSTSTSNMESNTFHKADTVGLTSTTVKHTPAPAQADDASNSTSAEPPTTELTISGQTEPELEYWYNLYSDSKTIGESSLLTNEGSYKSNEGTMHLRNQNANNAATLQQYQNGNHDPFKGDNSPTIQQLSNREGIPISHETVALSNINNQNNNGIEDDEISSSAKEGPLTEDSLDEYETAYDINYDRRGARQEQVTMDDQDSYIEVTTETVYNSYDLVKSDDDVKATVFATRNYIDPPVHSKTVPLELQDVDMGDSVRELLDNSPIKDPSYDTSNDQFLSNSYIQSNERTEQNSFTSRRNSNQVVNRIINNGNFEHVSDIHQYRHILPKVIQPKPEKYVAYPKFSQNQRYTAEEFRKIAKSLATAERHLNQGDNELHQLKQGEKESHHLKQGDKGNHHLKQGEKESHHLKQGDKGNHHLKQGEKESQHLKQGDKQSHHLKRGDTESHPLKQGDKGSHLKQGDKDIHHWKQGDIESHNSKQGYKENRYLKQGDEDTDHSSTSRQSMGFANMSSNVVNTFSDPRPMISTIPHAPTTMVKSVFESAMASRPKISTHVPERRSQGNGQSTTYSNTYLDSVSNNNNNVPSIVKSMQNNVAEGIAMKSDTGDGQGADDQTNDQYNRPIENDQTNYQYKGDSANDQTNDQYPFLSLYPEYANYEQNKGYTQQEKETPNEREPSNARYESNETPTRESGSSDEKYHFLSLYPQYANYEMPKPQEPVPNNGDVAHNPFSMENWLQHENSHIYDTDQGSSSNSMNSAMRQGPNIGMVDDLQPDIDSASTTTTIQKAFPKERTENVESMKPPNNANHFPKEKGHLGSRQQLSHTTPVARWVDLYNEGNVHMKEEQSYVHELPIEQTVNIAPINYQPHASNEFEVELNLEDKLNHENTNEQDMLPKKVFPGDAKEGRDDSERPTLTNSQYEWNAPRPGGNIHLRVDPKKDNSEHEEQPELKAPMGNRPESYIANAENMQGVYNAIQATTEKNDYGQHENRVKISEVDEKENSFKGYQLNGNEWSNSNEPLYNTDMEDGSMGSINTGQNITLTTFYVTIQRVTTDNTDAEMTTVDYDREGSTVDTTRYETSPPPQPDNLSTEKQPLDSAQYNDYQRFNTIDDTVDWMYGYTTESSQTHSTEEEMEDIVTVSDELTDLKVVRTEDSKMLQIEVENIALHDNENTYKTSSLEHQQNNKNGESHSSNNAVGGLHNETKFSDTTTKAFPKENQNIPSKSKSANTNGQPASGHIRASKDNLMAIDLQNDSKLKNLLNIIKLPSTTPTTLASNNTIPTTSPTTLQDRDRITMEQTQKIISITDVPTPFGGNAANDMTTQPSYLDYYNYNQNESDYYSNPYMDSTTPETTVNDNYIMDNLEELYDLLTELENELQNENTTEYGNQYAQYADDADSNNTPGKQAPIDAKEGQPGNHDGFGIHDGFEPESHDRHADKLPDYVDPQDAKSNANEYNRDHWWNSYWQDKRRDYMGVQEFQEPKQNLTKEGWGFPMPFIPNESRLPPSVPPQLKPGEFSMADEHGAFRVLDEPFPLPLPEHIAQPHITDNEFVWNNVKLENNGKPKQNSEHGDGSSAVKGKIAVNAADRMNDVFMPMNNGLRIQDDNNRYASNSRNDMPRHSKFQRRNDNKPHELNNSKKNQQSMVDERRKWESEHFGYKDPNTEGKTDRHDRGEGKTPFYGERDGAKKFGRQSDLKELRDIMQGNTDSKRENKMFLFENYNEPLREMPNQHKAHYNRQFATQQIHGKDKDRDGGQARERGSHRRVNDQRQDNQPRSQLEMDPFPDHAGVIDHAEGLHTGFETDRSFLNAPKFDLPILPFPRVSGPKKEYLETNLFKKKNRKTNFDTLIEKDPNDPKQDFIDIISDTIDRGLNQAKLVNDNKVQDRTFNNKNIEKISFKRNEPLSRENSKDDSDSNLHKGFYGPPTDPSKIRSAEEIMGDSFNENEMPGMVKDIYQGSDKKNPLDVLATPGHNHYSKSPFERHYTDTWQSNQVGKPRQDHGITIWGETTQNREHQGHKKRLNPDTKEKNVRGRFENEQVNRDSQIHIDDKNIHIDKERKASKYPSSFENRNPDFDTIHLREANRNRFENGLYEMDRQNKKGTIRSPLKEPPRYKTHDIEQRNREKERQRGREVVNNLAQWVERKSEDPPRFQIDNDIGLWREAFESFENDRDQLVDKQRNSLEQLIEWNPGRKPLEPKSWDDSPEERESRTMKPKIANKERFNRWKATLKDTHENLATDNPLFPFHVDRDRNGQNSHERPEMEWNNEKNQEEERKRKPEKAHFGETQKEFSVSVKRKPELEKRPPRKDDSNGRRQTTGNPKLSNDYKLENEMLVALEGLNGIALARDNDHIPAKPGVTGNTVKPPAGKRQPGTVKIPKHDTSTEATESDLSKEGDDHGNINNILKTQEGLMEIDPSLYGRVRQIWERKLQRTPTPQIQTTESDVEYSEMAAISEQQNKKKGGMNKDTLWVLLVIAVIGWIIFMVLIGLLIYYKRDRMCYKKFGRRSPYTSSYASSMPKHLMFPDLHSPLCSLSHPQLSSSEHSPSIPYSTNSSDSLLALSSANNQHLARAKSKPSHHHRAQIHAVNLGDNGSFGALSLHSNTDSMFERPLPPVPDNGKKDDHQNGGHVRTPSSFCPEMMFGASTSNNDENMAVQANTRISEKDLILLDKQVTKTVHDTFRSNKSHYQSLNTIRSRKAKSRGGTPETKRNENTNNDDEIFSASMHHLETSFDNIQKEADSRIQSGNAWVFTNQHLSKDDPQLVISHVNIRSPRPELKKHNMNLSTFANQTEGPNKTSSPNQTHFKPKLNTDKHPILFTEDQMNPGGIESAGFATPYVQKSVPHNYPQLSTPFTGRKPNKPVRVDLIRGQPNPNANKGKEQKRLNRVDGPRSNKSIMAVDADNSTDSNSMDAIYQSLTQIANKYGAVSHQPATEKQLSPSNSHGSTVSAAPPTQPLSAAPSTVSLAPPVPPPPKASPLMKDHRDHVRQYSGPMKTDKHVGPLYQNTQHLRNNNVIAVSPPKLPMDERDPSKLIASSPKKITLSINATNDDRKRDISLRQPVGAEPEVNKSAGQRASPNVKTKTSQQSQTRVKLVPKPASAKAKAANSSSPKMKKNKSGSYDFISKLPADIQEVSETSPHNSDKEHFEKVEDRVVLQDVRCITGDKKALVDPTGEGSPKESRAADDRRASPKQKPARKKSPRSPTNGHKKSPREKSQFAQASMMLMNTVPDLQRQQFIQQRYQLQEHQQQHQQQMQKQQMQQSQQQQQQMRREQQVQPPSPPPLDEQLFPPPHGDDDTLPMFPFDPSLRNSAREQAQRLLNTLSKKPGSSAERIRKIIPEQASLFNEKVKPELNRILNERNVKRDSVNV